MLRVFQIFLKLKNVPCALLRRFLMFSVPPPLFCQSHLDIQTLRRLRLPPFQSLLCLRSLLVFISSLCVFEHSVSVPLSLHYLLVSRSYSVCARILMKLGLYRLSSVLVKFHLMPFLCLSVALQCLVNSKQEQEA